MAARVFVAGGVMEALARVAFGAIGDGAAAPPPPLVGAGRDGVLRGRISVSPWASAIDGRRAERKQSRSALARPPSRPPPQGGRRSAALTKTSRTPRDRRSRRRRGRRRALSFPADRRRS